MSDPLDYLDLGLDGLLVLSALGLAIALSPILFCLWISGLALQWLEGKIT